MTRNSKEKIKKGHKKEATGSAWRHNTNARHKTKTRQSAPGDTTQALGAPVTHRLAAPGHCWAVHARFQHFLIASAWRWEASARCYFRWCGKLTLFLLFSRGGIHLGRFGDRLTHFWSPWRSTRVCGNYPFFRFVSLSSSTSIL